MRGHREHGQGAEPGPARRRRRGSGAPLTDAERIAAVAAGADVPVDEVLREVADFRLALETDMIIAAAAVDAENPEILSDVLADERLELATFHDRLLTRLADAAADDEIATRRARRAPRRAGWIARTAAAAAAVVAVVAAAGQVVTPPASTEISADAVALQTADKRYAKFSSAMQGDSASAVAKAADELHDTLEQLINDHASDPEVAQRTAQLLQAEIALLQMNDPHGVSDVLARAHKLVRLLKRAAPPQVRATVAPVLDAVSPRPSPKATKSSPPASPKATASPTASPRSSERADDKDDDDSGSNPLDNAP